MRLRILNYDKIGINVLYLTCTIIDLTLAKVTAWFGKMCFLNVHINGPLAVKINGKAGI